MQRPTHADTQVAAATDDAHSRRSVYLIRYRRDHSKRWQEAGRLYWPGGVVLARFSG